MGDEGENESVNMSPEGGLFREFMKRPRVDIDFQDLTYSIPAGKNGSKVLLRNLSGAFKSGELTAIMGPSGAGKSTLLNVLAGYRTRNATGTVLVNGVPRVTKQFRKMSRYIMQEDIHQPMLTVREVMRLAADLKLGNSVKGQQKKQIIEETMDVLRLTKSSATETSRLSGGEKKRLSIALELLNNPPVLFLDEPTTGLDDVSSSQCISLLKSLAREGRTVVCSIHTPSAKIFSQFDNVYIVAEGQCVYQGRGDDIVQYLGSLGLNCPSHYNPADFVIEVSSGEYGDHIDKMIMAVDNGKCQRWNQLTKSTPVRKEPSEHEMEEIEQLPDYGTSNWNQFRLICRRMLIQSWRDINYLGTKLICQIIVSLIIGGLYFQMGNDASKTIFIFGYCYICIIAFVYVPMLPALVWFPLEVQLLKREFFNRWYTFNSYYTALILSKLPTLIVLAILYVGITYVMSDQPMELRRILMFLSITVFMMLISEIFGIVISSQFSITNAVFLGPALSVPLMLLSVYSLGTSLEEIPIFWKIAMYCSYYRMGLEGLLASIYGDGRGLLQCPDSEIFCELRYPKSLLKKIGMEHVNYWVALSTLVAYYVLFQIVCYVGLKFRLCRNKNLGAIGILGHYIKSHFNFVP